ncbi:phage tail protein [Microcoleus sp. FACHB-831]|uniref:phage tail protein n=1 Tax=Microcoleus sp. FACHB-831 TaxID=2692827 RepID=UPI001681C3F5|nr:phage tail protein [Microcoleus sp. FACHB-831]MBD1924308.1 phage tail protein [Microcoleus sp. FACHB-831]
MSDGIPSFPEILVATRFDITLHLAGSQNPVDAAFQEFQGFKRTQKPIEFYEVTPQKWGQANHGQIIQTKIPGNVESSNLILKRGMTKSVTLWNWFKDVEEGKWGAKRKDGILTIYDLQNNGIVKFEFQRAWPISYKIGDVGMNKAETEIEELELAVESFIRTA